jgi:hypothetical protein
VAFELVGGLIAEELHAVATFEEGHALGQETFQFDRADLRAVLFCLAAFLGVLILIQLAMNLVGGAVEEVDRRPEQVFEVGLEARVAKSRDKRVEDVGHGAADGVGFGQWSRVWFVLEGAMAIELEFGDEVIGGR